MGVDEMKEAIEKGYLGEKLDMAKTFKFTREMLEGISIASESNDKDASDWVREVIAEALVKEDYKYELSTRARQRRSNTSNTLVYQQKSPTAGTVELDAQ